MVMESASVLCQEDDSGASRRVARGYHDGDEPPAPAVPVVSTKAPPVATGPARAPSADASVCLVCMDKPRDALLRPCNHVAVCLHDAKQLVRLQQGCPLCRSRIDKIERVFL